MLLKGTNSPQLKLANGFTFPDLYTRDGLERLDHCYLEYLGATEPALRERLLQARANADSIESKQESALLIELAPTLEEYLAHLFGIEREIQAISAATTSLSPLYECKRTFVKRKVLASVTAESAAQLNGRELTAQMEALLGGSFDELAFAKFVLKWLADGSNAIALGIATSYAAWATMTSEGQTRHASGVLFRTHRKVDHTNPIPLQRVELHGVTTAVLHKSQWRSRDGFSATDLGMNLPQALDQAHYCILCHPQGKDSCSRGLRDRKTDVVQKSSLGAALAGCPLEEKISEMHALRIEGSVLGAFAIILVDNPMVAATGHRICNDCMKACIYQKQEPVDVPQSETSLLKEVLSLPWGFEIYSLLTRWNPLNLRRPFPRPSSGHNVLVVGLGPAGFTLAHYLLNDGHTVVAVDGLKIEPLPASISGIDAAGIRVPFSPIFDVSTLFEDLDSRRVGGFGGVAEYGITVRWNKNYLKLIQLLLERRSTFALYGGVRFGGTLTPADAFAIGFDHVALATGAGRPTHIPMPNSLARGVRMASDFLMALQLTGAAKRTSLANLQLRLPIVVIGGGLTAIDAATEALTYYVRQVEKFLVRYETLAAETEEAVLRSDWTVEDTLVAEEFLSHARVLRNERIAAAEEGRAPRFSEILDSWGGATVAYRKRLQDAPSVTLNHEEVAKALEEGVRFAENLTPLSVEVDTYGHLSAVRFSDGDRNSELPARALLIAAGTQPNTVIARELPGDFQLSGRHFAAVDEDGKRVQPEKGVAKPAAAHVLTSIAPDGRGMSYFGDLHPSYAGNVVKAMASAKQGHPVISRLLARRPPSAITAEALFTALNTDLRATVHAVNRLTPDIVEVIVKAPRAARAFRPGQFFRLQNYESFASSSVDTVLTMEGLALTGAAVDRERGLISTIVLEMGGSSDLCNRLMPGEPVVLMGPTGTPTEIPSDQTVVLVGGGLGNAVLFSIGAAFREANCKVLYFAGYKKATDRYKVEEIENAADVVIWSVDSGEPFPVRRPQDRTFVGNIVAAMQAYAEGALGPPTLALSTAKRLVVIGSDRMMAAVAKARHGALKPHLLASHIAVGSINSPMQCMIKEVCAQCLQIHHDPETGSERIVFSCFNQDQLLDEVDFHCLRERLTQNALQEKLTARWLRHCEFAAPKIPNTTKMETSV